MDNEDGVDPLQEDEMQRPLALVEKSEESPPFGLVAELLDLIEANKSKKMKPMEKGRYKQDLIRRFFERDRQRNTYGVKETFLANAFIDALGMNKQTAVAQKLLNWKQPTENEGTSGDFASVAKEVIQSRSMVTSRRGKLSIRQTNDLLDDLSKHRDKKDRANVIKKLYHNMTANELKWVIRIILKDLKISFRERTVFQSLHPDAIDLFNVCSDLKRVCWTLYDPAYRLPHEDAVVKLFMPFKPMLSKRHENDFAHIVKLMSSFNNDVKKDGFVMEEKLDGERIQIHMRGPEFRYFSRRDHDYTYLYGKSKREGSLTPELSKCIHENLDEIILDGEMLAWDPRLQKILPFGTLKTAANTQNALNNPWATRPVFKVFDVLYAKGKKQKQGQNLLSKPYKNRREALMKFTKESKGHLEWAEARTGKSAQDIVDYLDEVMNRFGEGLVVKNPKSPYVLNARGDSWIKVKPDYMLGEGETLELIVMGGLWGSGHRGGGFGSFICGIIDDEHGSDDRVLSFAKFGSGLSIDILSDIKSRTEGKWRPYKGNPPPSNMVFGTEKPDEWIAISDSFVVQIKAGDLVRDAAGYGAKYCLRFPRLSKYHRQGEKSFEDVTKFTEYISQHRSNVSEKRKLDAEAWSGRQAKKVKRPTSKKPTKFAETFEGADLTGVNVASDIFNGLQFWVIEGDDTKPGQSKKELEQAIYKHGGDYQQSLPSQEDRVVICGRNNFFVAQSTVKKGASLISPSWVTDSIHAGRRKALSKRYYVDFGPASADQVHSSDDSEVDLVKQKSQSPEGSAVEKRISSDEEQANEPPTGSESATEDDSDAPDSEREGLQALEAFKRDLGRSTEEPDETYDDLNLGQDPSTLFDKFFFMLDTKEYVSKLDLPEESEAQSITEPFWAELAEDITSAGGTLVEADDSRLTHVVLNEADLSRARALQTRISKNPRPRNFVKHTWVYDSIGACHQEDEFDYRPV